MQEKLLNPKKTPKNLVKIQLKVVKCNEAYYTTNVFLNYPPNNRQRFDRLFPWSSPPSPFSTTDMWRK